MKNSEKKIRNDIILVSVILAAALIAFFIFKVFASEGSAVRITVNGQEYKTVPLHKDAVINVVSGENGEYVNTVTVKDGAVSVSYANCPDRYCEKHRAIKYKGESIACLPHGLAVTVEGGEDGEVDLTVK